MSNLDQRICDVLNEFRELYVRNMKLFNKGKFNQFIEVEYY